MGKRSEGIKQALMDLLTISAFPLFRLSFFTSKLYPMDFSKLAEEMLDTESKTFGLKGFGRNKGDAEMPSISSRSRLCAKYQKSKYKK